MQSCLSLLVVVFGLRGCGSYNRLVKLDQDVNKKWAEVQKVYQRRADLIPNLVSTVSGAANFEKSTLTEVTKARASVGQVKLDPSKAPTDAAQLEQFQQAQGQLSTALSRLAAGERELSATARDRSFSEPAGPTGRDGEPDFGRAQ